MFWCFRKINGFGGNMRIIDRIDRHLMSYIFEMFNKKETREISVV